MFHQSKEILQTSETTVQIIGSFEEPLMVSRGHRCCNARNTGNMGNAGKNQVVDSEKTKN